MKKLEKLKVLKRIIKEANVPKPWRKKVLAYLAVTVLHVKMEDLARYFKKSERKVVYVVSRCSVRLKENKAFMAWMHIIAKKYLNKSNIQVAA